MTRIPGMNFNEPNPPAGDEEPQSLSLLGGVAGGGMTDADLIEADAKKRGGSLLNQTGLMLVIVAVVAAVSLYAMRLTQGDLAGNGSTEAESKIENWLIKVQNPRALPEDSPLLPENRADLFGDTDTILAMFNDDQSKHQVPVEYVKKNPFILPGEGVAAGPLAPVSDGSRGMKALRDELAQLRLESVMTGGARSIAVINGEFYQIGAKVGSFTVESMDPMSVQLTADGHRFVLTIDGGDKSKRR